MTDLTRVTPRFFRLRDAPAYLGMDRNRFNAEVRPYLTEVRVLSARLRNGEPPGQAGQLERLNRRVAACFGHHLRQRSVGYLGSDAL